MTSIHYSCLSSNSLLARKQISHHWLFLTSIDKVVHSACFLLPSYPWFKPQLNCALWTANRLRTNFLNQITNGICQWTQIGWSWQGQLIIFVAEIWILDKLCTSLSMLQDLSLRHNTLAVQLQTQKLTALPWPRIKYFMPFTNEFGHIYPWNID